MGRGERGRERRESDGEEERGRGGRVMGGR